MKKQRNLTPPSRDDAAAALRLFVEKVNYLLRLSFREVKEHRFHLGFKFEASAATVEVGSSGPSQEQRDAFVNTLRMFIQERDSIALDRVSDHWLRSMRRRMSNVERLYRGRISLRISTKDRLSQWTGCSKRAMSCLSHTCTVIRPT